ncbi:MAG: hypothetical protein JNL01_08395 [Bdellovibrionales bacterium]|nr:hypothetical protein [Bdellovibrionales bacterium]
MNSEPTTKLNQAFFKLLDMTQGSRLRFVHWLGKKTYEFALRKQKRMEVFKKGSMVDTKAQ